MNGLNCHIYLKKSVTHFFVRKDFSLKTVRTSIFHEAAICVTLMVLH